MNYCYCLSGDESSFNDVLLSKLLQSLRVLSPPVTNPVISIRDVGSQQNEEYKIHFPGETIIGCINEIHIHAQMKNDQQTIKLYNYLNTNGIELIKGFDQKIEFSGHIFNNFNSLELFTLANGEWNSDKTQYRVGNLNGDITSYKEYERILKSFNKIPFSIDSFLDF